MTQYRWTVREEGRQDAPYASGTAASYDEAVQEAQSERLNAGDTIYIEEEPAEIGATMKGYVVRIDSTPATRDPEITPEYVFVEAASPKNAAIIALIQTGSTADETQALDGVDFSGPLSRDVNQFWIDGHVDVEVVEMKNPS